MPVTYVLSHTYTSVLVQNLVLGSEPEVEPEPAKLCKSHCNETKNFFLMSQTLQNNLNLITTHFVQTSK